MERAILIQTTIDKEDEAKNCARILIKSRLAACVNIHPNVSSFYIWKGEVQEDQEFIIQIKTFERLRKNVYSLITKELSYDCPQFITFPIDNVSHDYYQWMCEQLEPIK